MPDGTLPYPKLGILAGGGDAPRQVVRACLEQGRPFFVFCLEGQADPEPAWEGPHTWLPLGAFGSLRDIIAREHIDEVVMIGRVRRPSLAEIKPDWQAFKALASIRLHASGDDALLRSIGETIERLCHVRVIGVQDVLGGLLLPPGLLGQWAPDAQAKADIDRGRAVAEALGAVDVGQAVVVQQGIVLGVEAAEGTDALIARCKNLRRQGPGGVLVKMTKPQQDNRFDLPALGPHTLMAAHEAGLRGIAALAGRTLLINPSEVKAFADEHKIFLFGLN
ncbi:MAG: UDP-2,3-diacylglucosamine diphosphatase LpxI [Alphaproteobacteria bacterium]|nr:UDP-2,3-diacylglucosamine diphosphatase LpxI [Alphaproteobacteria bacterium]